MNEPPLAGSQSAPTGEEVDRAREVMMSAAQEGNAAAQFYLGRAYQEGDLFPKDSAEAFRWFSRAADQDHVEAQAFLGLMFAQGEHVEVDYTKARHWWERAAEQGLAFAQSQLGHLYNTGSGVERDPVEAVRWWRLAADNGEFDAQFHLACSYSTGNGVEQDHGKAAMWLHRAARKGHPFAQNNLGVAFWRGEGVLRDHIEAYKWITQAAQELPSAEKKETLVWRDRLRAQMSEAEVAEAERRVADRTTVDSAVPEPRSPYFRTMERMKRAITRRRYEDAARFARQNLEHIFDFVNEVILDHGKFDIPSIPALERGGTMLALADDATGLDRMRKLVAAIPPLASRIPAVEKHLRSRDLFRKIPEVLAQRGACLQSDMSRLLEEADGHHVAQLLAWLEKTGRIRRERHGKTHRITLPVADRVLPPAAS